MQLKSIHVSLPKTIVHDGVEITTGIFKELVEGPVRLGPLNLEGDGQADLRVHGGPDKAVYAYPFQHYTFWESERPDLSFFPGKFGENLSVLDMDERAVHIGDVFRIGTAVLRITSPRMPCYKLGIKMQDPSFLKNFTEARKSGFYFGVMEEGTLEANQPIEHLERDGHHLSVEEVFRARTSRNKDRALLEKAIGSPSLPANWTTFFQKQLARLNA